MSEPPREGEKQVERPRPGRTLHTGGSRETVNKRDARMNVQSGGQHLHFHERRHVPEPGLNSYSRLPFLDATSHRRSDAAPFPVSALEPWFTSGQGRTCCCTQGSRRVRCRPREVSGRPPALEGAFPGHCRRWPPVSARVRIRPRPISAPTLLPLEEVGCMQTTNYYQEPVQGRWHCAECQGRKLGGSSHGPRDAA